MDHLWHDLRYTLRTLSQHPGFVVAGASVLALGIGVNTAIFSVVNAILFRPLPVPEPDSLRYLYTLSNLNREPVEAMRYRDFRDLRERGDVFSDVLFHNSVRTQFRVNGEVDVALNETVSPNYFDVLGVQPIVGRGFKFGDDESVTGAPVAVISYDLWQGRYNGDPDILGKTLELTTPTFAGMDNPWRGYIVVGVMPQGFRGIASPWEPTQFWLSFLQRAAINVEEERIRRGASGVVRDPLDFGGLPIGRLKPGISSTQARAAIGVFEAELKGRYPADRRNWSLVLTESKRVRLPFDPRGEIVPTRLASALLSVSGVLMLIAAANLAGMLMARGITRRGEMAVRVALGSGAWRLTRQLLTESLVLSTLGGLLALPIARWLVDLFVAGTPTRFVRWQISAVSLDVPVDARVLLVTALSCLITGVIVGLAPARQALNADILSGLSGSAPISTRATRGVLRAWIVVPQVCLSLTLLLVAGVVVRTLLEAELAHPGYHKHQVALLDFEVPAGSRRLDLSTREARDAEYENRLQRSYRVLERAKGTPRLSAVSLTMTMPGRVPFALMHTWVVPRDGFQPDSRHYWTSYSAVSDGYFAALQIPLLNGRLFDERDRRDRSRVVVVSEDVARTIWPHENPVGEYLARHSPESSWPPEWMEVIGVVGDVTEPLGDRNWNPAVYVPLQQDPGIIPSTMIARGSGTPAELLEAMRQAIADAEPTAITSRGRMLDAAIGEMLYPRRVAAAILALAGAIGLLLASMGLYGVISYAVEQRVREIGVRMALGAERRDIVRLILREGGRVVAIGILLGLVLTYAAIRLTSRLVVAIPSMDALTFLGVPLLLGAVILVACYVPALRAARVDPMVVLRAV
jgi:putative ABC transport system permease protein